MKKNTFEIEDKTKLLNNNDAIPVIHATVQAVTCLA